MDNILLEKAVWEIAMAIFDNEKVTSKIFKALNQAHKPALNAAMAMPGGASENDRIEAFMRHWIEVSMSRAWMSVDSEGTILNEETVSQLFLGLVVPFGEEHPFSCIPAALMPNIGRPSMNWPFVAPTVAAVFAEFREAETASSEFREAKRRRKGRAQGEENKEE